MRLHIEPVWTFDLGATVYPGLPFAVRAVQDPTDSSLLPMLLLTLGVVLLLLAALDALWTTMWVNGGGGPISGRMAGALWWGLRRTTWKGRDWPLSLAGPVILVAVVLTWVALLWAGWTLVFSSDPAALSYSSTGERPDWAGRVYFAGYALFTLGIGNVVPERGAWEVVTAVASGSGFLFITLGISYVISVLGAVVTGRAFAGSVGGLGGDAEEIVLRAWDGERYTGLTLPLVSISTQLNVLTQQHLAYPVLHYYHARDLRHRAGLGRCRARRGPHDPPVRGPGRPPPAGERPRRGAVECGELPPDAPRRLRE